MTSETEITRKRLQYQPKRVRILLVGEAPPTKGNFFYCGDNDLLRYMRKAVGGPEDDVQFLESFMERGWYLDDLVRAPICDLSKRKQQCRDARGDLAVRIGNYQPAAIVCLLYSIRDDVENALLRAASKAQSHTVPFAGWGHQGRFLKEMQRILPQLEALP